MAKKPVMMGGTEVMFEGELRRFETKCRKCGAEFIITIPAKKKFNGQVMWDHGCPEGNGKKTYYTVNSDHPDNTGHKNHPLDSEGTMYEII